MAKRRLSEGKDDLDASPTKQPRFGLVSSKLRAPAAFAGAGEQSGQSSAAKGISFNFSQLQSRFSPTLSQHLTVTQLGSPSSRYGLGQTIPGSSIDNPIDLTETCDSDEDSLGTHCSQIKMSANMARALKLLLDDGFDPQWAFPNATDKDVSPRQMLQAFGRKMMSITCRDPECRDKSWIEPPRGANHPEKSQRTAPCSTELEDYETPCNECAWKFCYGCGIYADNFPTLTQAQTVYCCNASRLMMLFSLLLGPDTSNTPNPQTTPRRTTLIKRIKQKLSNHKLKSTPESKQSIPKPDNTAPETSPQTTSPKTSPPFSAFAKGTGYGGRHLSQVASGKATAANSTSYGFQDALLEAHFKALAMVLPTPGLLNDAHRGRHRLLTAMISRSPLIFAALELLRCDSIEEIGRRESLYRALLTFLDKVASHGETRWSVLVAQRLYPQDQQLLAATFSEAVRDDAAIETVSSVALTLERLGKNCEFFLSKASTHSREFGEGQGSSEIELAKRICHVADKVTRFRKEAEPKRNRRAAIYLPPSGSKPAQYSAAHFGEEQRSQEREWLAKDAVAWLAEHRVAEIPDDEFWADFSFATAAKALSDGSVCKGRMKSLIVQLSSMRNTLPEGIYVRHASSRIDVMKVLFVGPSGTPYEGGLFEFDMFCGADFPSKAPKMIFRTTGNGTVRFNPNLYNDGKVCLSLLGTWDEGQDWIPGESTIEQLLVSIQAMIFCENPWYNEPGFEQHPDEVRSDRYNMRIQQYTVLHAMIHWLRDRLCQPQEKQELLDATTGNEANNIAPPAVSMNPPTGMDELWALETGHHLGNPAAAEDEHEPDYDSIDEFVGHSLDVVEDDGPSTLAPPPPQLPGLSGPIFQLPFLLQTGPSTPAPLPLQQAAAAAPAASAATNKAARKEDDKIWGPVIRHHFASRAVGILALVKEWEKKWVPGKNADKLGPSAYPGALEHIFRAEKFIGEREGTMLSR